MEAEAMYSVILFRHAVCRRALFRIEGVYLKVIRCMYLCVSGVHHHVVSVVVLGNLLGQRVYATLRTYSASEFTLH